MKTNVSGSRTPTRRRSIRCGKVPQAGYVLAQRLSLLPIMSDFPAPASVA
ncbi:hypothetical protein P4123_08795 [Pseudomonas aeruginosa]|nr:hypothetical protein [Pseudomonas aeruginosa]